MTTSSETISKLLQKHWKLLLTLFVAGILFYIYPICHQAITSDNQAHMDYGTLTWYLRSKRWGICLLQKVLFMRTFVPSFWIVVNVAFLSISAVLASDLFKFQKNWVNYVFGLMFITFPQYAYMMKFALTADAVGVGFFLVTLGFREFMKSKHSWKSILGIICLFTLTFSIYISLIYIPLTLYCLLSFAYLVEGRNTVKQLIVNLLKLGAVTIAAYVLFYFISKAVLLYFKLPTDLPSYFTDMIKWWNDSAIVIIKRLPRLLWDHLRGKAYFGEGCFALVWIPFAVCLFIVMSRKSISASRKVLALVILVCAMIAPFIQIVLFGGFQNPRVFFAQAFLFAGLWSLVLDRCPRVKPDWVITGVVILFIRNGYLVTQNFHYESMIEDSEKNLAMRVMNRIDSLGVNIEDHKLLLIGSLEDPKPVFPRNPDSFLASTTLSPMFSRSHNYWSHCFLHNHGFVKRITKSVSYKEFEELLPFVKEMPIWPAHGSVVLRDDVIIVKLSNNINLETNSPRWSFSKR